MRDERRAPLKTPALEAMETRAYPGWGKKARRVGSGYRIDVFSSQSPLPNRQDGRRVSSLQHILGHVCRFIVQERI